MISLIVATYNYGRFIDRALESAAALIDPGTPIEIIIVDGGSTDDTAARVARWQRDGLAAVMFQQSGRGLANACNEAIARANGDLILRLDADDVLLPYAALVERAALEAHPDVDFVYGDYQAVDDSTGRSSHKHLPPFDPSELRRRGDFLCGGTMYRREVFQRFGTYDETLTSLPSYDFMLRLLSGGAVGLHLPLPIFEYRFHGGSLSDDHAAVLAAGRAIASRHGLDYQTNEFHPRAI